MRGHLLAKLHARITTIILALLAPFKRFRESPHAQASVGLIATGLIGALITVIVILKILSSTAGDLFGSVAEINAAVENNSTGDATADDVAGVFPFVIGILFVLGLVGMIFTAFTYFKHRRGGF